MNIKALSCVVMALCGGLGCRTGGWQAGPALLVSQREVAAALQDPVAVAVEQPSVIASVPVVDAPTRIRGCCVFGMDLKAKVGAVRVPGFEIGNITSVEALGPNEYDNGNLTLRAGTKHKVVLENNGLIYTCRGGFIDTAHIRDNADRVLYAAMQLQRWLPKANADGTVIDFPDEGTARRVTIKPIPPAVLQRLGRARTSALLAGWIGYQLSVWHEIVTWYGWESTRGFSERLSGFSPEDPYSNLLGVRIAMGIIETKDAMSRDEYNHAMDAWIPAALARLVALPREQGRVAMGALDGRWWDSTRAVPENELVRRRALRLSSPVSGWLVPDAFAKGQVPRPVQALCEKAPPPLPLEVPQVLPADPTDLNIADLVKIEFRFNGWTPDAFPLPASQGDVITPADFDKIIADVRKRGERELGPGFDRPGPAS